MPSTLILGAVYGDMILAGAALGAFGVAAASFAINFAVSVIVNRIFGATPPSQQDQGTRQQIPPNTANSIPIVYGDAYLGGTFVDAVLTTDQKTMYYVLAISSISPNGTFTFDTTKMYYGDRSITFGTGPAVASLSDQAIPPNVDTTIAGNLFIYLYTSSATGTITGVNTTDLPSTVMGSGSGIDSALQWTGTRQMNGLAFAIVKLVYSREAQTTSLQPITFHVTQNMNGLDRARPGDVWNDYISNTQYGGAIGSDYIDSASVTTLNTYSDELITFTDSSGNPQTQRRYKINGVINAGETVLNNIDKILNACDTWMAYQAVSGKWSLVPNKPETIIYEFTDDNIIGDIRVSATDITSSINAIEAKFPNRDNKDQPAYVNLDLAVLNPALLYPNEPVNKYSVTFDLVNESVQTHYLANRILEQAREDLLVSFSTTYYGIQIDAGDVVSVYNTDYGWCAPAFPSGKPFRVMKVNEASLPDGSLGAKLEMSEYNAAVYDNQDITQFSPVPNSGLPSPVYFSSLAAPTFTKYETASVPHFDVTVFIPVTGRVTFGNLYYTTSATPSAGDWKLLANATTSNSQPVPNNTYYTFAGQILPAGTYYFAYSVGNEISQSGLSPASTAMAYAPVAPTGPTGPTGTGGPTGSTGATGATGTQGNSFRIAYYTQAQNLSAPSVTPNPTTGSTSFPTSVAWAGTITSPTGGQSLWAIDGTYNPNTNQTSWSAPYLTQGIPTTIQSDNYVLNTSGWQIQRDTGDAFFNNISARGNITGASNITISGQAKFSGNNNSSYTYNIGGTTYTVYYSAFGITPNASVSGSTDINAGVLGLAAGFSGAFNVGVIGIGVTEGPVSGIGIGGNGDFTGGYFYGGTYGINIAGGTFLFGSTNIAVPPNNSGYFLRGDGVWASLGSIGGGTVTSVSGTGSVSGLTLSGTVTTSGSLTLGGSLSLTTGNLTATAPGSAYYLSGGGWQSTSPIMTTAPANSGSATVSGNSLNLLGSTSTGIAGAYIGTTGSGNTVTFGVQTTSPSDIRLKEEIQDSDLGLEFIKKLRPVSYKLKADPIHQKGYGFIADEVEKIIPLGSSLVYEEPNWQVGDEIGFKTIHYPSYIAVLTKAMQEMEKRIADLEEKLATK